MEGRATFTTVMSSPTMKRLMQQMSRTPILRLRLSSSISTAGLSGDCCSFHNYYENTKTCRNVKALGVEQTSCPHTL